MSDEKQTTIEVADAPSKNNKLTSGRIQVTNRELYFILVGIILTILLASLDQSIVAPSLPKIIKDLGSFDLYSWVATSYMLTSTAVSPSYGRFSDIFGRRRVYIFAVVIFLVGSALCGASTSLEMLIVSRAIQGVGGGGIINLALIIIADIVSPRDRGKYSGIVAGCFAFSSVIGPLIGGALTDNLGWRWIFYVNLPIGIPTLFVLWIGMKKLDVPVVEKPSIDYWGTIVIMAASVALLLPLNWAPNEYAWEDPLIIGLLVTAFMLFLLFIVVEWYVAKLPIVPPRIMKYRNVALSSIINFFLGFAMFEFIFFLTIWFENVKGFSATEAGLELIAATFGIIVGSVGSGILVTKTGHYYSFPIIGNALVIVALGLIGGLFSPSSGQAFFIPFQLIAGLGIGLQIQVTIIMAQNQVDPVDVGPVTSIIGFFRIMGGVFGITYLGLFYRQYLTDHLHSGMNRDQIIQVQSDGVMKGYLYSIPFVAVAFVAALFVKRIELKQRTAPPAE